MLVVSAGDMFQGTLVSNLAEGAPVIDFYNWLGVSAAALGNHEFDYGPVGKDAIVRHPGEDPRGAIKARAAQAHFPILSCNVHTADGKSPAWVKPSTMVTVGGVKVGLVGASTPETPSTTNKKNLVGLTFDAPEACVLAQAKALRAQGAQAVIVLLHGGSWCPGSQPVTDLSKCDPGDLMTLVHALPKGLVNLVVGGHTHMLVNKRVGDMGVVEAAAYGQWMGLARVPLTAPGPTGVDLVHLCGETIPGAHGPTCQVKAVKKSHAAPQVATFEGAPVHPVAAVEKLLAPAFASVKKLKERPIGVTLPTSIEPGYRGESPLGDLVADVFRRAVKGADIGMTNGGGLRAPLPQGKLVYGSVYKALPFDNHMAILTLPGTVLRKMVVLGVAGGHGGLSWSGLTFHADGCKVTDIRVHGRPLRPKRVYRIVTNEYLAGGGSGFDTLGMSRSQVKIMWSRPYLRDQVAQAFSRRGQALIHAAEIAAKHPRQHVTGQCTAGR